MKTKSRPVSTAVLEEFRRDLRVLEREIVREMQAETECCGVTLAQCHVLIELVRAQTLSLTELADALGLDRSTLSRTVDGMVKAGLVFRATDPDDRRAIRLTCTPEGAARVGAIDDACNRKYGALLGRVGPGQRQQILDTVRFLADGIPQLRPSSTGARASCCDLGTGRVTAAARPGTTAPRRTARAVSTRSR